MRSEVVELKVCARMNGYVFSVTLYRVEVVVL